MFYLDVLFFLLYFWVLVFAFNTVYSYRVLSSYAEALAPDLAKCGLMYF